MAAENKKKEARKPTLKQKISTAKENFKTAERTDKGVWKELQVLFPNELTGKQILTLPLAQFQPEQQPVAQKIEDWRKAHANVASNAKLVEEVERELASLDNRLEEINKKIEK
jgi:hypothetical protein